MSVFQEVIRAQAIWDNEKPAFMAHRNIALRLYEAERKKN